MYRFIQYFILFLASVLLQVCLFDNLSISVYLNPLIYIAFIILLPLDATPIVSLAAGLIMGVTMDYAMGAAGINLIATLAVTFARPNLLRLLLGADNAHEGGLPTPQRMGLRIYLNYLIVFVLLHHTIFFLFESLSWTYLLQTLLRIVVSSTISVGFIWIIGKIFTGKLPVRV